MQLYYQCYRTDDDNEKRGKWGKNTYNCVNYFLNVLPICSVDSAQESLVSVREELHAWYVDHVDWSYAGQKDDEDETNDDRCSSWCDDTFYLNSI